MTRSWAIGALGQQLLFFAIATELAALLLVPLLIVAQRFVGRRGLWSCSVATWGALGGIAISRYIRAEGADFVVLVLVPILLLSWTILPALLIDRLARKVDASAWTRYLYGILGYNLASLGLMALVFAGSVVIAIAQLAQ